MEHNIVWRLVYLGSKSNKKKYKVKKIKFCVLRLTQKKSTSKIIKNTNDKFTAKDIQ